MENEIEIFNEDSINTMSIDAEDSNTTIDINSKSKTYKSRFSFKEDMYSQTEKYEYRILINPIRVESRLIEFLNEPPTKYAVKDGVVLESNILLDRGDVITPMTTEFIDNLKKDIEWHDEWAGSSISMYILSLHSEIVSTEEYRRYLRQFVERIKISRQKIEKVLIDDNTGLQITDEYSVGTIDIWYPKTKQEKMSNKEVEKAIKNTERIEQRLFDENSKEYVNISKTEFRASDGIVQRLNFFLNHKQADTNIIESKEISATQGFIISALLTLLLSWVVSWFVNINPFLIFIIIQVVAFLQNIIGNWIGRSLDKAKS